MSYFYFNGFYSYEMGLIVEEKSIGYNQYYMEDIRSQIILDGELMHAYSGTTPLNEKIRFTEFPYLRPGDNQISWGGTGTVRSVYIAPNWRTL